MNPIFLSLLLGGVSMLGYGFNDVLVKKPSIELTPLVTLFWRNVITVCVLLVIFLYSGEVWVGDSQMILLTIGLSIIGFFGPVSYFLAVSRGKVSIVSSLSKTYLISVVLVGFFYFGETLGIYKIAGMTGIFAGAIFTIIKPGRNQDTGSIWHWLKPLLITIVSWSIFFSFITTAARALGGLQSALIVESTILVCSTTTLLLKRRNPTQGINQTLTKYLFVCGVTGALGTLGFTYGVQYGLVPIVATLSASSPLVAVILSLVVFHEKLSKLQGIGIICALLGIFLIGAF